MVQCSTLQYSIVQYSNSIAQVSAVQYREAFVDGDDGKREDDNSHGSREGVQYIVVQYGTVQYSTVRYSTVQYSTVQYSTVQYSTVRVQYSTVQVRAVQYRD